MKPVYIIVVYLCFYSLNTTQGQNWIRIIGGYDKLHCKSIYEHYDKGYILTGQHWTGAGENSFGWVMKTDINGCAKWSKSYGKSGKISTFTNSCETTDGGLICFGSSNKINQNCTDPLLVKLNACGEKEWCKIYNSTNCNASGIDISQVPGGGYMMLIEDWIVGPDVWLFRLDSAGGIIWAQNYLTNPDVFWSPLGRSLKNTTDSCFLITGHAYSPDSLTPGYLLLKMFIAKVDLNGGVIFEYPWGTSNGMVSQGLKTIENSKHVLFTVGNRMNYSPPSDYLPTMFKSGINGQALSCMNLGPNSELGISTTINWFLDSTLVIGTDWQYPGGDDSAVIVKTDTLGNILSTKCVLPHENLFFNGADVTYNDRIIIVGNSIFSLVKTYVFKLTSNLEYDSVYTRPFTYDSLCPHPIVSDTIPLDDCQVVIVGLDDPVQNPEKTQLHLYPNPAKGQVTVEMPQYLIRKSAGQGIQATTIYHQWDQTRLYVLDITGKLMFSVDVPKKQVSLQLNTSSWLAGIYLARLVFMNEVVATEKFIILKK